MKVLTEPDANAEYSEFVANKIRQRVNDPTIAEKLIPKDHGFGTRRVPLETGYYETFNRENVTLVDLNETPIERITQYEESKRQIENIQFDVLIYATGFDAITGAFDRMDITGRDNQKLARQMARRSEYLPRIADKRIPKLNNACGTPKCFGWDELPKRHRRCSRLDRSIDQVHA